MMEDKLNLHAYSYSKLRFSDFVVFQKKKWSLVRWGQRFADNTTHPNTADLIVVVGVEQYQWLGLSAPLCQSNLFIKSHSNNNLQELCMMVLPTTSRSEQCFVPPLYSRVQVWTWLQILRIWYESGAGFLWVSLSAAMPAFYGFWKPRRVNVFVVINHHSSL